MRIAALTGGTLVPSARFRVRQYIPELLENGICLQEFSARYGSYPPPKRWSRPFWACATLMQRLPSVVRTHKFDAVLLQREMVSTLLTLEPFTKKPRILDIDDAVFLYRGGRTARRLAEICDHIICGNAFLAEWFSAINRSISIIPTAVDTERYTPATHLPRHDAQRVIGWIGTASNLKYLYAIEPALHAVLRECPQARLRIVCDQPPQFRDMGAHQVEFLRWTEELEVAAIQSMHVGIMPLEDSLWARGKCSFKMLQYMACGIPAVVSPVGANADVLRMGNFAFGAHSEKQWVEALRSLIESEDLRKRMGEVARRAAETFFSVHAVAPRLAECLRRV